MIQYTNDHNIPLALQVWLVADSYDHQKIPNYISATTLMKPLRQMILGARTLKLGETIKMDLSELAAKAMGTALHDSIEKAWLHNYEKSLEILGYPENVISRILINPTPEEVAAAKDPITIYMEQRALAKVGKWTVGGKFDFVADGIVHDNKSTSTYAWVNGSMDEYYRLQGSLYRWLNQDKITEDFIRVNFLFTDWQRFRAKQNPDYPQAKTLCREFDLMSVAETQAWVEAKLAQIEKYIDAPDHMIPECTKEELWMADTEYKYYADPTKTTRATKVFGTDKAAADKHWKEDKAGKGIVIAIEGTPKRCDYCDAVAHCSQAKKYFND